MRHAVLWHLKWTPSGAQGGFCTAAARELQHLWALRDVFLPCSAPRPVARNLCKGSGGSSALTVQPCAKVKVSPKVAPGTPSSPSYLRQDSLHHCQLLLQAPTPISELSTQPHPCLVWVLAPRSMRAGCQHCRQVRFCVHMVPRISILCCPSCEM